MRFPEEFIRRVMDANNLVDIIGEVTQLKPSSGGYMGRCPFPDHAEKTASFSVSEVKQVYHCFGCAKSGNLVRFVREYHGMSYPETLEFLAMRANIPLPASENTAASTEEERRAELRRQVVKANNLAQSYFFDQVKNSGEDHPAWVYINSRGLSRETVETFGIGYSTPAWDGLTQFLKNRGVTMEIADQAGLARRRKDSSGHFDLFRERLMFPIRKISGEVVGFGGRILEKGEPKYLNSPETPVFHKGRTLYGLDQTARYIRSEDRAILVEGYMDLIALFQAGFKNVAATLGTALTLDHAYALKKITPNITVLFDGDAAGQAAAEKSLPLLLQAGLRPRGLILPDGQDPDDFIKHQGAEAMAQTLESAPDLFNLCVHNWTLNFRGSGTEKLALLEKLQPILEGMQDVRLREIYLKELSPRIQMHLGDLKKALQETNKPDARNKPALALRPGPSMAPAPGVGGEPLLTQNMPSIIEEVVQKFPIKRAPKAERILLSLCIKNRANLEFALQQNIQECFHAEGSKQIFQWLSDSYGQRPAEFDRLASLLTELVDDPHVVFEFGSVLGNSEGEASDGNMEQESELLRDCVRRIRADGLKRQIEKLTHELRVQSTPERLENLMRLQRERMALLQEKTNDQLKTL